MPRNKKRNEKQQQLAMKKANEKNIDDGSNDGVKRDETSSTSMQNALKIIPKNDAHQEYSVQASSNSTGIRLGKPIDEERASISSKKKRKPINLMMYVSETDDEESQTNTLTMRYVDVARSAMVIGDKTDEKSKGLNKEINIALEEFPLLPPSRSSQSEALNVVLHDDMQNSDASSQGSIGDDFNESSNGTSSTLVETNEEDRPPDFPDEQLETEADVSNEIPDLVDEDSEAFESDSSTCFDLDENGSSDGSFEVSGSNETSSGSETAAYTDGGGDANNSVDIIDDCSQQQQQQQKQPQQQLVASVVMEPSIQPQQQLVASVVLDPSIQPQQQLVASVVLDPSIQPQQQLVASVVLDPSIQPQQQLVDSVMLEPSIQPSSSASSTSTSPSASSQSSQAGPSQSSDFSQEWLEQTVRRLAVNLNVSIPQFNFTEPNIDFARNEGQFDDANYRRLEDRALFSLRLAQNKSFFGKGKYM